MNVTTQWGWIGGPAMPDAPAGLQQGYIAYAHDPESHRLLGRGYGETRQGAIRDLKQRLRASGARP